MEVACLRALVREEDEAAHRQQRGVGRADDQVRLIRDMRMSDG